MSVRNKVNRKSHSYAQCKNATSGGACFPFPGLSAQNTPSNNSSNKVNMTETTIDPRHPSRLEKNTNILLSLVSERYWIADFRKGCNLLPCQDK